jgi:hypothetical protein
LRYDADVTLARRRRLVAALTLLIAFGAARLSAAAPAAASASIAARIDGHVADAFDLDAFARTIATRDHIRFRHIAAADIDCDGDLDVVASTELGIVVWVNDGAGHLTAQPPALAPSIDSHPGRTAWRGTERELDQPIQSTVPSVPAPHVYAHAPPPAIAERSAAGDVRPPTDGVLGSRSSRAPPL